MLRSLFIVLVTGIAICQRLSAAEEECIRDYHSLEAELVDNDLNLDSLTRSFFLPNMPSVAVVDVYYTISNSSDPNQHPLLLEIQGVLDEKELAALANYHFRWSRTPIYLFLDPWILEKLALFTIRIRSVPARLVIRRPLCDNYTISGISLPQYHLNQMTSLLKTYSQKRKSILSGGLDNDATTQKGYVSFYTDSFYKVIGYDTDYAIVTCLYVIGLIALAAFISIAIPLLINYQYDTIYKLASEQHTHTMFCIWGTVIICFLTIICIYPIDVYYLFVEQLMMPNLPARWIPYLALVASLIFMVVDLLVALVIKKKKDFPLPYALKTLFCHTCKNTIPAQILAIWSAILFIQMATFHLTFIFLAFVAAPIQAGSTLLLIITGLLSAISLTTLFLAVFQKQKCLVETAKRRKRLARYYLLKSVYLILFICILMFMIFFATSFIRITIYVGDLQSGGIPSLIASLPPSALLAGIGFLGKRVLEKYMLATHSTDNNLCSQRSSTVMIGAQSNEQDEHIV